MKGKMKLQKPQTIFRSVRSSDGFTMIPNDTLRDERLSFKARGLLALVLSNRDDWEITAGTLGEKGKEGRDAIRGALNELKELGYAKFERLSLAGRFTCVRWTFFDTPKDGKPKDGKPSYGKQRGIDENPSNPKQLPKDVFPSHGKPSDKEDYPKEEQKKEEQAFALSASPQKPLKQRQGTYEEVKALCKTIGLTEDDATYFFENKEANDWTQGNKPLKDWRAAVRSWKAGKYFPSQKPQAANRFKHSKEEGDHVDF